MFQIWNIFHTGTRAFRKCLIESVHHRTHPTRSHLHLDRSLVICVARLHPGAASGGTPNLAPSARSARPIKYTLVGRACFYSFVRRTRQPTSDNTPTDATCWLRCAVVGTHCRTLVKRAQSPHNHASVPTDLASAKRRSELRSDTSGSMEHGGHGALIWAPHQFIFSMTAFMAAGSFGFTVVTGTPKSDTSMTPSPLTTQDQ